VPGLLLAANLVADCVSKEQKGNGRRTLSLVNNLVIAGVLTDVASEGSLSPFHEPAAPIACVGSLLTGHRLCPEALRYACESLYVLVPAAAAYYAGRMDEILPALTIAQYALGTGLKCALRATPPEVVPFMTMLAGSCLQQLGQAIADAGRAIGAKAWFPAMLPAPCAQPAAGGGHQAAPPAIQGGPAHWQAAVEPGEGGVDGRGAP
jgi:hypothetical protein